MTRVVLLYIGISFAAYGDSEHSYRTNGPSLIPLLSHPTAYLGKEVDVAGYLTRGRSLYLSRELAELGDGGYLLVNDDTGLIGKNCPAGYAKVIGTFAEGPTGFGIRPVVSIYMKEHGYCYERTK